MRTIVNIPDQSVDSLGKICKKFHVSRAEAIRQAVEAYIEAHRSDRSLDEIFGLWEGRGIDALKYEDKIRSEWSGD